MLCAAASASHWCPLQPQFGPRTMTVRFNSDGKIQFHRVLDRSSEQRSAQTERHRTQAPAVGNLTTAPVSVNISGRTRPPNRAQLRPARGAGWVPNRAAVIGSSGALEAVAGNGTDCVRVDGTSGPCGRSTTIIDGEIPSGAINGANTMFLSAPLRRRRKVCSSLRMACCWRRTETLLSERQRNHNCSRRAPNPGDILQVWSRISRTRRNIVDSETPSGAVNTSQCGLQPRESAATGGQP